MTRSTCAAVAACALLTASAAADAVAASNKQADRRTQCTVRGNAARLDVRCPAAPLADLLGALHKATGLRSTYPGGFAGARVSVTMRNASLADVLKSALAEFNFATWVDDRSPQLTQLSIVGMRRGADDPDLYPPRESAPPPAVERQPAAAGQAVRKEARSTEAPAEPAGTSPQQWVVTGAPATPAAPPQVQQALAPTRSPPLEVDPPSAYLLSPPTGGRTPVLPQRAAETPILKPGVPADNPAN